MDVLDQLGWINGPVVAVAAVIVIFLALTWGSRPPVQEEEKEEVDD